MGKWVEMDFDDDAYNLVLAYAKRKKITLGAAVSEILRMRLQAEGKKIAPEMEKERLQDDIG